jgi:hypothetical protein
VRLAPWAEQVISDAQRPDFHLHVGGPDVQVKWKSSGPRPMTSRVYGTQGPLKERRSTNPPPSPGRLPGATEGPQARTRPPPAAVNADPPSRIVSVASWSRVRFLLRSCVFQIWRFIGAPAVRRSRETSDFPASVRGKIARGPRLDREASSAGPAAGFSQPAARPQNLVLQPPATDPP